MPDFATYDTTNSPSGPEKPRVFGLKVLQDITNLRENGINDGTITLVKGYLQAFTDGSDRVFFKIVREDGTTVKEAMCGEYFLREALDFDGQTAVSFRMEDAAALALDAANDGILSRHPSNRRIIKNGPAGGVRHYLSEWSLDGISFKRIKCFISSTTTATGVVRDDIDGFLMDDGVDEIRFGASKPLPADYTAAHDCLLEVICFTEQAELTTDTIDMQIDYEKATIGADPFDGVLTNALNTAVTLGTGNGIGVQNRVILPMPFGDASNPLAPDDLIRGVLKRNGLTNVADVVATALNILVPCFGGVDHQ